MKDIDDIWDQADNADNDVTWASLRYSAGPFNQTGRQ